MDARLAPIRTVLIVVVVSLLVVASWFGRQMREATRGAADPDTQQVTVTRVADVITRRIVAMGTAVTDNAVHTALQDQLSFLGTNGFIRVRIASLDVDVFTGTDYGISGEEVSAVAGTWQDRLLLPPVDTQADARTLYVLYLNTALGGNTVGELIVGSAGPTPAEARTSAAWMTAMWSCAVLAGLCAWRVVRLSGTKH
jgi:hypothetical protein